MKIDLHQVQDWPTHHAQFLKSFFLNVVVLLFYLVFSYLSNNHKFIANNKYIQAAVLDKDHSFKFNSICNRNPIIIFYNLNQSLIIKLEI